MSVLLDGHWFLVPEIESRPHIGQLGRSDFCQELKKRALVGSFDSSGRFAVDQRMTFRYAPLAAKIGQALVQEPGGQLHAQYCLASIDKATGDIFLEHAAAQRLGLDIQGFKFELGMVVIRALGVELLLVDMHGPVYEVIVPDTIDLAMSRLSFALRRQLVHWIRDKQQGCVNVRVAALRAQGESNSAVLAVCSQCPGICQQPPARDAQSE